jgi:thiol-disulfide isomerase/thioredoxin
MANAQGIQFETGSWKAAVAKARTQNRLLYVDVYTTWCGPCKMLEKTVFPQQAVGDKYNPLFVNYHIDAEKGEGIALAKKYAVTGFPTHLFIDPKTEAVVYRTSGAGDVAAFNENAAVALQEQADPMTWDVYTKRFVSGTRTEPFLRAYLRKAERLAQPNDAILDAYLNTVDLKNMPDSTLYFIEDHTHTIWNNAVPLLRSYRARLDARDTGEDKYHSYASQAQWWLYPSYEQLKKAKEERKLTQLIQFIQTDVPEDAESNVFFYRKRYYEETNNPAKLKLVELEELTRMASKTLADFETTDTKTRKSLESQIRYQLTAMTIPEGKSIDTIVAENIALNATSFPSMRAANTLNDAAWKHYENKKATAADLQQALNWSAKAMEFSASYPEQWAPYADTHASLLYRTGRREDAIRVEQQAVAAFRRAGKTEEAATYEQTIQKMKSGTY